MFKLEIRKNGNLRKDNAFHEAVLHIGTNIGDRETHLQNALKGIQEFIGEIKRLSSIYETEAWGHIPQRDFLNQAILVKTQLDPHMVLAQIQKIEKDLGREKEMRWGPRIIDIDIIFFEDFVIYSTELDIPHTLMHKRNFVLEPLMEIIPNWTHPVFGKTVSELRALEIDNSVITLIN